MSTKKHGKSILFQICLSADTLKEQTHSLALKFKHTDFLFTPYIGVGMDPHANSGGQGTLMYDDTCYVIRANTTEINNYRETQAGAGQA